MPLFSQCPAKKMCSPAGFHANQSDFYSRGEVQQPCARRRLVLTFSHGRLATNLPWLPRRLQLPIPVGVDLLLTPSEHALRRDVADHTVQGVVIMLDVALHHTPHIFQRQWRSRPDAQLSLPGCNASVTSSRVRSIILTGEGFSISS